jgi:hypothetical protein
MGNLYGVLNTRNLSEAPWMSSPWKHVSKCPICGVVAEEGSLDVLLFDVGGACDKCTPPNPRLDALLLELLPKKLKSGS